MKNRWNVENRIENEEIRPLLYSGFTYAESGLSGQRHVGDFADVDGL
ncbi:MAG: hypothetical protein NT010_11710 [Proteobacteria bacterium]|nr:hypothetical protein [Pseudomonadota bacterium]